MKATQEQFNPEQEAVLTYVPDFQSTPFTVTGLGESLLPIAEAVEREQVSRVSKVSALMVKTAQAASETAVEPELTGLRATIAAKMHDLRFGTHMFEALQDKRDTERDLKFAGSLGLLTDEVCAKHRKALDEVRTLR